MRQITRERTRAEPTRGDALSTLAARCLEMDTVALRESPRDPLAQLAQVIARAIDRSPKWKPSWAAKAEAVLHLTERLLGFARSERARVVNPQRGPNGYRNRGIACGTYSTPDFISDEMCKDLLRELERTANREHTVLDLSLEAGNYPLALLMQRRRPRISMFGMDRDREAISLARIIVGFALRQENDPDFKFSASLQDSIWSDLPRHWPRQFDAVIGNPPWKTRHPIDCPRLLDTYRTYLTGQFDVYLAFMLRAHGLLKEGGLLSMVVPGTFLFNRNAEAVRRMFLEHYDLVSLTLYPRRAFVELPSVAPIAFVFRKKNGAGVRARSTRISYSGGSLGGLLRPQLSRRIAPGIWLKLPAHVFHPLAGRDSLFLISLEGDHRLSHAGEIACGLRLRHGGTARVAETFAGIFARDIRPFHACQRHAVWYKRGSAPFDRDPRSELISCEKILFQDVRCMTLARRLVAARSGPQTMGVSTASAFVPRDPRRIGFYEALLNSEFANAWYKLRDVHRCIKLCILTEFPVVDDETRWSRIAELGEELRHIRQTQHRYLPSCSVARESEVFEQKFPKLSQRAGLVQVQLDTEVYSLYELSKSQRRVAHQLSQQRVF
ncbi:MAG TPA: N-6 DNA methylase [Lacunisphaera sp.]|nr:N-6 DNA methylase [Lacunisphaera sp.]